MTWYFNTIGCQMPNSDTIHLKPLKKSNVYADYCVYMKTLKMVPYEKKAFFKIWKNCTSHVKVTKVKRVTGKCFACSELALLKFSRRDAVAREMIETLIAYHR